MLRALALCALLTSCTATHSAAVQLRYAGIAPIVGGGLLAVEPELNGRPDRQTTEIGVGIALLGLVLVAVSCDIDPQHC